MSWLDRDYARDAPVARRHSDSAPLSVTGTLIAATVFIAFLTLSGSRLGHWLEWLGVMQANAVLHGQVWRLVTATYLHAGVAHVLFNMLALYFLGPLLERAWGRGQFFLVYTLGGIAGNVLLTLAGSVGFIDPRMAGLGASGSILTLLGAAAVLFPGATVYVYFLLPLRIRTVAVLYAVVYVVNVLQRGANYGGDLCHLAGLAVGVWWAASGGFWRSGRPAFHSPAGLLARRLDGHVDCIRLTTTPARPVDGIEDALVDRILCKVHDQGAQSLSVEEREFLRYVSEHRRDEP